MMNYSGYPAPTYPNYGAMGQQQLYTQRQEVVRVNGRMGDQEEKFKKYCEKIEEIWR